MKKIKVMVLILIMCSALTACGGVSTNSTSGDENDGLPVVFATLFPQYDFVKQIAGDRVHVKLLLPPGVEAHSYDPTPKDIAGIDGADAFLYTGSVMEPWAVKIIETVKGSSVRVVDLSEGIKLIRAEGVETSGGGHNEGVYDPHYWLDPNNAKMMVSHILEVLIEIDPQGESVYRTNAGAYLKELTQLDTDFYNLMAKAQVNTIYYGGHFVFGYFAERYGLVAMSPFEGFSPDAEPTPQHIAALIDAMKVAPYKVIYYEELVNPKIAVIVAEETGAEMLLLHGAHNLSKQELEQGVTYLDIMRQNLEKLKLGVGYRE